MERGRKTRVDESFCLCFFFFFFYFKRVTRVR